MRKVAKFFCTAGPIKPELNYYVDPLTKIEPEEVEMLIYQQKYFVLHAPRQTGKTSYLLALRDHLNAGNEFIAVYANIESGQALRNNVEGVAKGVCQRIAAEANIILNNHLADEVYQSIEGTVAYSELITRYLDALCQALPRPLVLFIDEIDALVGDSLVSVLRQIRSGYINCPTHFPKSP